MTAPLKKTIYTERWLESLPSQPKEVLLRHIRGMFEDGHECEEAYNELLTLTKKLNQLYEDRYETLKIKYKNLDKMRERHYAELDSKHREVFEKMNQAHDQRHKKLSAAYERWIDDLKDKILSQAVAESSAQVFKRGALPILENSELTAEQKVDQITKLL